jgi:hypothetical protein
MNPKEEREQRWFAYFLGEVSREEMESIEEELRASPKEAEEYEEFIQSLSQWAKEPVPYQPIHMKGLGIEPIRFKDRRKDRSSPAKQRLFPTAGKWFWGLAAAALLIFAFSQLSFSINFGNTTIKWGRAPDTEQIKQITRELSLVNDQLKKVSEASAENKGYIQTVAMKNLMLENDLQNAVNQLVYYQQIETRTRYNDVQKLLHLRPVEFSNVQGKNQDSYPDNSQENIQFDGDPWLEKSTNHMMKNKEE